MALKQEHIPTRLLIIGGTPWLTDRANIKKIPYFLIHDPAIFSDPLYSNLDNVILKSFDQLDSLIPLIKKLHKERPFSSCVTLTEKGLLFAAKINDLFNLKGVGLETVIKTKNKYLMRLAIKDSSFSVDFDKVKSLNDIKSFSNQCGFPFILKKSDGVGSELVSRIDRYKDINKKNLPLLNTKSELIVEKYVDGREFSVEAFSFNGIHKVIAITEKINLGSLAVSQFVSKSRHIPAELSNAEYNEIVDRLNEFLTSLAFQHGPSHTEIKLHLGNIKILETQNRTGGNMIPEMIQKISGVDLYSTTIDYFSGRNITPLEKVEFKGGICINHFVCAPGKIICIDGIEGLRFHPNVVQIHFYKKKNEFMSEIKSTADRLGYMIVHANTSKEAMEISEELMLKVEILVN